MEIAVGSSVRVFAGAKPEIAGAIGTVTGILSSQYQVALPGDDTIHILSPGEVEQVSGEEEDEEEAASSPEPPGLGAGFAISEEAVSGAGEDEEDEEEEDAASSTWPVWPSRKEATQTSLSQVDKTTWIGRPVMVMKGPKTGSLGRVFSTASGWVEIHEAGKDGSDPFLVTSGEAPPINKRAHELNLLKLFSAGEDGGAAGGGGEAGDDNGDEELSVVSSSETPREMQVGDVVVVLEGAHEGKNGKITEIEGDQLALSIKAVSAIVHKTRSQVELKKEQQHARAGPTAAALPSARRGPKKKDDLLGKRVVILETGKVGVVSRAGDGLFEVEVSGYDAEMKRRSEIKLVEGEEGAGAAAAEGGEEDSDDEANGNGSAANRVRRKRKLRAPSSTAAAAAAAAAQDDEDKKRPRITRRGMAPSAAPAANANKKPSAGNNNSAAAATTTTSNGGAPNGNGESYPVTKLEATRKQRQEVITYFVSRCKERQDKQMPNRENLQEWLDDIKGQSSSSSSSSCQCCEGEEGQDFSAVPLLFDFPFCAWCRVEKEDEADFCWNAACWKSPVFRPNAPSLGSAVPLAEIARVCFVNPCSQVSISPLVTLNLMTGDKPAAAATVVPGGGYFGQGYQEDAPTRPHALDRRWTRQALI